MSSLIWDGDSIFQRVGKDVEELGHVKIEPNSGTAVLWLRDTRDVFAVNGGYVRGDEFASMANAKEGAAMCASATLLHQMWLAGLLKTGSAGPEVAFAALDAQAGKPLTESTFKEEMRLRDKSEMIWKLASAALGSCPRIHAPFILSIDPC